MKYRFSLSLEVSVQAQPKEAKAGTGAVSGLVTLKGEPARGVTVLLQRPGLSSSDSNRVRTDENGRFRFSGIIAGTYSISALAPGHISPGVDDRYPGGRGLTLNVSEGGKVENINLEIKQGAVIAGRVTDSQGRPVIEETVNLSKLDKNGKPQMYQLNSPYNEMYRTDDRGGYRIFGLPEGRYLLSVGREQKPGTVIRTSSGISYPRVYYPNARSEVDAKVVEVAEGSEATDIDITVHDPTKSHGVYGRVVNADTGQPVSGMDLIVTGLTQDGKPMGGWEEIAERSKANGEFRLMGVAPGRYALFARTDLSGPSEIISEPVIFDVVEGDTTGVEALVRKGGSISGVVVIEGTSDPKILSKLSQVNLYGYYMSVKSGIPGLLFLAGAPSVNVNADGGFRMGRLQTGKLFITVNQSAETRGLTVARIEYNGAAHNEIDVTAGEQVTGARVILSYSTYTLRGELKVVGGPAPPGLRFMARAIRVDQPFQGLPVVEVDGRGEFVFENVAPGEYEIGVLPNFAPNGERFDLQTMRLISSFKARAVVVGPDTQPVTLVVDLGRKEGKR
ncbi:MAG TPA: carboxypeptidase-like regulatory domain-containing protein [Blastocatellia bacterium]|nr:carboxypeptidase-like regulatory domain-containing protein [Blastocatellia bacterium]